MAIKMERDPVSGHQTTGHEWNGIKELNTRVPRVVYFFLVLTIGFLVLWTTLMPSWPLVSDYFRGVLGVDQRSTIEAQLRDAALERADWTDKVSSASYSEILADPKLMATINDASHELFMDNCAACHGATAAGALGFPNLAQASMLWGSSPETIEQTIMFGINDKDADSRFSQMPAFGRDYILTYDEISQVVGYVRSLSGIVATDEADFSEGAAIFAENCVACHGDSGQGVTDAGAANLTDSFWIYGNSRQDIRHTIAEGRMGHMPAWHDRLSPVQIKMLVAYLTALRGSGE